MTQKRDKKAFEKTNNQEEQHEEDRNTLDGFKEQQLVDDIPLEDLKIEKQQEDKKKKSQDTSQSEKKYNAETDL
ncbi:hypothetical protein ACLIBH_00995 [Virgibacillus sp. W0430]|uniref:hypothetical protein n=1 Tax=Virgibacillus sp. W0430 TaxID=3391580 RepID=UPI003F483B4B